MEYYGWMSHENILLKNTIRLLILLSSLFWIWLQDINGKSESQALKQTDLSNAKTTSFEKVTTYNPSPNDNWHMHPMSKEIGVYIDPFRKIFQLSTPHPTQT